MTIQVEINVHAGSLQELTEDVNFAIHRVLPRMRLAELLPSSLSYIARLSSFASTF
jgi:hypothetical protein